MAQHVREQLSAQRAVILESEDHADKVRAVQPRNDARRQIDVAGEAPKIDKWTQDDSPKGPESYSQGTGGRPSTDAERYASAIL